MNRNIQGADSAHCTSYPSDCFLEDSVTIPADFACANGGEAILRWIWNSAEGPEMYANCLDLTIGTGTTPTRPTATQTDAPQTEMVPPPGECFPGESCLSTPSCCPAGQTCFKKDSYWASCSAACAFGVHASDPLQFQTPWSCERLGSTPGNNDGNQPSGAVSVGLSALALAVPLIL